MWFLPGYIAGIKFLYCICVVFHVYNRILVTAVEVFSCITTMFLYSIAGTHRIIILAMWVLIHDGDSKVVVVL